MIILAMIKLYTNFDFLKRVFKKIILKFFILLISLSHLTKYGENA